jgi:hypothetical protein
VTRNFRGMLTSLENFPRQGKVLQRAPISRLCFQLTLEAVPSRGAASGIVFCSKRD